MAHLMNPVAKCFYVLVQLVDLKIVESPLGSISQ